LNIEFAEILLSKGANVHAVTKVWGWKEGEGDRGKEREKK
jgi:hypothetical protein